MLISTYDIDGVIYLGDEIKGIMPNPEDIIITGRSIEEARSTLEMLRNRGINNQVFFNPVVFNHKSRVQAGQHKGNTIRMLKESGYFHGVHFEDDEIQMEEILKIDPTITIVHVKSDLVEKENVRR